jgi:hypothetical protein
MHVRGSIAFATIRASKVKSELMPAFGADVGLEIRMATSGLPLSRDGSQAAILKLFKDYVRRSSLFTKSL